MFEREGNTEMQATESKVSELKRLENTMDELKKVCIEINDLSQDLNNLVVCGSTTKPEEAELSKKERSRGKDRISEVQLKALDCVGILVEGKRLINLIKEKLE